ncbi:MAG: 50S ribosomal protein L19e [Nanobdellota archaeon]
MNLRSKKQLAAKTFGVGKARIVFVNERIEEIKEAITKQDMRNLQKDGAIIIKEIKGRSKNAKKTGKKGMGNVRKKVNTRKKDYVILTRKLRRVIADKKQKGELNIVEIKKLRQKIRNKMFKSKAHLKEYLGGSENENTKKKKKRK